jgi:hypothetical protein
MKCRRTTSPPRCLFTEGLTTPELIEAKELALRTLKVDAYRHLNHECAGWAWRSPQWDRCVAILPFLLLQAPRPGRCFIPPRARRSWAGMLGAGPSSRWQ